MPNISNSPHLFLFRLIRAPVHRATPDVSAKRILMSVRMTLAMGATVPTWKPVSAATAPTPASLESIAKSTSMSAWKISLANKGTAPTSGVVTNVTVFLVIAEQTASERILVNWYSLIILFFLKHQLSIIEFQTDGLCKNEGQCVPWCDSPPYYQCKCTEEWEGYNCTIKVSFSFVFSIAIFASLMPSVFAPSR